MRENIGKKVKLLKTAKSWWTGEAKKEHAKNPIGVITDFHPGWEEVEAWYSMQFESTPYPNNDIALDVSEENKKWKFVK
jgi:hypothetical protein